MCGVVIHLYGKKRKNIYGQHTRDSSTLRICIRNCRGFVFFYFHSILFIYTKWRLFAAGRHLKELLPGASHIFLFFYTIVYIFFCCLFATLQLHIRCHTAITFSHVRSIQLFIFFSVCIYFIFTFSR